MRRVIPLATLTLPLAVTLAACEHPLPTAAEPRLAAPAPALAKSVRSSGYVTGADGARLFYRVRGHGPDVAVVLHGGPGLSMSYLVDDLAPLEPGRTLIYYDQRGGGASDLPDASRLTAERMVSDLEAVRQQLGLARMTLIGHSWGGGLAALYATRYPDRVARLVLLGPGPSSSANAATEIQGIYARFPAPDLAELIALNQQLATVPDDRTSAVCERTWAYLFARYQASQASLTTMRGQWCSGTPAAMRYGTFVTGSAVGASFGASFDFPVGLTAALAGRRIPTLVVEGAASPFVLSAQAYAAAIPGAALVVLPNAGHFPWLETPHDFFHGVSQFLSTTKHLAE
jgi:proline iminopeptidase